MSLYVPDMENELFLHVKSTKVEEGRWRLLPDDASIEEGEDEVERDGTPGDKVVYPGPEVSL